MNPMTHGLFSWYELMTDDIEGAKSFYGELLGWQFETNTDTGMEYTLVKVEGMEYPIAGMYDKTCDISGNTGQIPPHWGNYITVDDVDVRAARAEALGGNVIVPPTDIPTIGRFALIQDPQGAVVSLITYAMEPM